jgi:hypothetical protein
MGSYPTIGGVGVTGQATVDAFGTRTGRFGRCTCTAAHRRKADSWLNLPWGIDSVMTTAPTFLFAGQLEKRLQRPEHLPLPG